MSIDTPELLYNPFDPLFRADPYPFYDRLRELEPVHRSPMGMIVLSRYEDVARALRGAEFARDIEEHTPLPTDPVRLARRERFQRRRAEGRGAKTILNLDPPDHTRLRRLVTMAFTPKAIEQLRARVEQLVGDILDRAEDEGSIELIDSLAFPVPFQVISDLLALPTERSDEVREWSQALTAALEPTASEATLDESERCGRLMGEYINDLVDERRHALGDDVLSALIQAEEAGDRLSPAELVSFVTLLYIAGHETTVNLIGNGTLALLRHPDELRRWRDDPALDTKAVDELLRYDGPVQNTVRVPLVDVELGGIHVPKGTLVATILGAANHDPEIFEAPHELRLDRPNANRHLAFAAGVHYCLGASLAKLEAQVAITTLIRRFPNLELAGAPEWRDRITIRGVSNLPLSF